MPPFWKVLLPSIVCLAHAATTPQGASIQVRNAPGHTVEDTYLAIKRGLALASLEKRESYKANMSIAKSWSGATLLSVELTQNPPHGHRNGTTEVGASIEVTCETCYVHGSATAELNIKGDFNASQLIEQSIDAVNFTVRNFTDKFENYIGDYVDEVTDNLKDGLDASDFDFPTIDLAFDMDIPPIPDANLHFQFDDMELYLELETVLSAGATYEVTLFATQTPVGVKMGKYLQLGAVITVDLLLSVEGAIDISSGFHIKLDDGVAIDIALFSKNISDLTIHGGTFEFLPVTLHAGNVALSAALRVGAHLGVEVVQPESPFPSVLSDMIPHIQSGIEVAVFANVAEFITNVTYSPDDKKCDLKVVQEYNLAVGAIAGASVVVDWLDETNTWGPVNEKSIPVFTTTLAEVCGSAKHTATSSQTTTSASDVGSRSDLPTITPAPERRQDLTTTKLSTTLTRSGISCKITGLANCPNSQQVTTRTVVTSTITTAIPSGVHATWPSDTQNAVVSRKPFGAHARSIKGVSGSPVPYVAPASETHKHDGENSVQHVLDGRTGGVKNEVIIGVCVGLGMPLSAGILGVMVFLYWGKKRYGADTGREDNKDGVVGVREERDGEEVRE